MKSLAAICLVALMAGTALGFGSTNVVTLPYELTDEDRSNAMTWANGFRTNNTPNTNVYLFIDTCCTKTNKHIHPSDDEIRRLCESGAVCRVIGHKWESGCGVYGCGVFHTHQSRHCLICGKVETFKGEWK